MLHSDAYNCSSLQARSGFLSKKSAKRKRAFTGHQLVDRTEVKTIKRFALLPEPFSRETLELTELGKLRRDVIRVRRAAEIEALYA